MTNSGGYLRKSERPTHVIGLPRKAKAVDDDTMEPGLSEDELTQLYADQAVLLLAIERGYLTNDQAAMLQLEIR